MKIFPGSDLPSRTAANGQKPEETGTNGKRRRNPSHDVSSIAHGRIDAVIVFERLVEYSLDGEEQCCRNDTRGKCEDPTRRCKECGGETPPAAEDGADSDEDGGGCACYRDDVHDRHGFADFFVCVQSRP